MNEDLDTKLLHLSAIAFGPIFISPAVRERRAKMFEVNENSVIGRYAAASRPSRTFEVATWVLRIVLAAVFLIAGTSKLAGARTHVETFENLGVGQWLRYVTGSVEVIAAILIMIPRTVVLGAALLTATMIAATATHLFLIGGSPLATLVLLLMSFLVAWYHGLYR
jgi:hypothetical protein